MKNYDNNEMNFSVSSFENYKDEIDNLNLEFQKLMKKKSIQKDYKRYLKEKSQLRVTYNNFEHYQRKYSGNLISNKKIDIPLDNRVMTFDEKIGVQNRKMLGDNYG